MIVKQNSDSKINYMEFTNISLSKIYNMFNSD